MQLRPVFYPLALCAALSLLLTPAQAQKSKEPKVEKKVYSLDDINRRVTAGLEWLVDHQGPEGQWSIKSFSGHTTRVRATRTANLKWVKPGEADGDAGFAENRDVAGTALGLLCFAGSGHVHTDGEYKEFLAKAVAHLKSTQGSDGCFGEVAYASMVHDSAIATMALAEVYALSNDESLKPVVAKGVEWILSAQNDNAGWRYGVKGDDSDMQMTGWCLMALKSAKLAGIEADYDKAWAAAGKFMEKMTVPIDGTPRSGYTMPGAGSPRNRATVDWAKTPDMDAIHVTCRLFSGDKKWDLKNKDLKKQAELFNANPPKWEDKQVDLQYWYFATLAMFQYGGKDWDKWSEALLPALMENQRGWTPDDKDTFEAVLDEFGSFDAVDAWHSAGGRVWSTAACTLMLQTMARQKRLGK